MMCRMYGTTGIMKNKLLEKITERESLWNYLARIKKPIVLYGMGDGAVKVMNALSDYGLRADEVFASDEFVRGHSFCGYKVKKLSEIESEYDDFIILLCFGAGYDELIEKISEINTRHELYAPDLPVFGEGLFTYEYLLENINSAEEVYSILADEFSKKVYADVLNFKISGKIKYLFSCESGREEIIRRVLRPNEGDTYYDLGAYNGDTVAEILSYTGGRLKKAVAFEPDFRNYKKLSANTDSLGFATALNAGAWSEDTVLTFSQRSGRNSSVAKQGKPTQMRSVDSVAGGEEVTLLKLDVEGAESEALCGAAETIRKFRPRLEVACYHRNGDMFSLPLLVKKLNPDYQIYMRHHRYIPAWETNIYAK